MNQRFQNEEIRRVAEQYAGNEFYQAIRTIGSQLESELDFGLCPEECFMESLELLSAIADKGEDVLPDIEDIWLRKHNEYSRLERHVGKEEIRKTVGIVLAFTILALDSSRHPFYRHTLPERLMQTVAHHQFPGWTSTLSRIFSVPLSEGWFDAFIEKEPEEPNDILLPKELDTPKARKGFAKAIERKYMEAAENGKYHWIGTGDRGVTSQLAYFLGRVYNYEYTIQGNAGENFPEESLNELFGVKRLYSSLTQVYNAQKPQRWRSKIDALFE